MADMIRRRGERRAVRENVWAAWLCVGSGCAFGQAGPETTFDAVQGHEVVDAGSGADDDPGDPVTLPDDAGQDSALAEAPRDAGHDASEIDAALARPDAGGVMPVDASDESAAIPGVRFMTVLGMRYLGATAGGVVATATAAAEAETFTLRDVNGGALESGDMVTLQVASGVFWQATDGGGSGLTVGSDHPEWQGFLVMRKLGAAPLANGDVVGLQTTVGRWVSAENGGGGPVFGYGSALGQWEELVVSGLPSAL
jgi:hypothetical protein